MILYKKLEVKYRANLGKVLPARLYNKIANEKDFYLQEVTRCGVDLDDLGYTFEDYLMDFKESAVKYTEKKTVFNILKMGANPSDFGGPTFTKMLKEGFNYTSNVIKRREVENVLDILDIDCDLEKYNLRLEIYRRHIELYGNKEDLERFQEDFSIKQPVLWEKRKEKWHLAFDGLLCEDIRYKSNRDDL